MRKEQKIWGERWIVHEDTTHTTNLLWIKAGFRCSWHRHQCKYNTFVVISGRVGILIEAFFPGSVSAAAGKTERREVMLKEGESYTVPPGLWHEFRVYEDGLMLEEMYVVYDDEDIEREVVGGPIEQESADASKL